MILKTDISQAALKQFYAISLYFYNNSFFVFHDAGMDEFNSAKAAIESNGINVRTEATVEIWINKTFYK